MFRSKFDLLTVHLEVCWSSKEITKITKITAFDFVLILIVCLQFFLQILNSNLNINITLIDIKTYIFIHEIITYLPNSLFIY